MNKLNEYVKIAEAARIVGVCQNTLRAWADSGKIPVTRTPSGYRLFRKSDLETLLVEIGRAFPDTSKPRKPR